MPIYVPSTSGTSEVIQALGDADATIANATTQALLTVALTASRSYTLPLAASVAVGRELVVGDCAGSVSPSLNLILVRAGSDTIDGATSEAITSPYGMRRLFSDGVSKWTFGKNGALAAQSFGPIVGHRAYLKR